MRNTGNLASQSERLLANPRNGAPIWAWEQGFFAWEFGRHKTAMLPRTWYFYPCFDGLPGGLFGYDWSRNPCGFVAKIWRVGPKPSPWRRSRGRAGRRASPGVIVRPVNAISILGNSPASIARFDRVSVLAIQEVFTMPEPAIVFPLVAPRSTNRRRQWSAGATSS